MTRTSAPRRSARERLLTAANELFYREGVHTVGIDRIIEHAGVAKASLYNTFGSKDELVRAYLEFRHDRVRRRVERHVAAGATPRDRLLAVFDAQAEGFVQPDYNGCPFISASAESSEGSSAERATRNYRVWLRGLFTGFATEAGVADPAGLARQLHLLYDGASLAAGLDGDPTAAAAARTAAVALIDTAPRVGG
ncbi:TetR/AcrR family transcriptional regulator [Actinomadura rayongensis]|uniref:TetR family transcriptional regulator n=1 Tax=Actinomadura rayongensis TaxID=1429076 RepID=A0A6I4WCF0_9ACTN|nr:TetR/AcrR family transcriptional regulator [Actinomadura rayongensis]MXQ67348.1 TetR family transcriptional regulator [Actinomadura rayongensis]